VQFNINKSPNQDGILFRVLDGWGKLLCSESFGEFLGDIADHLLENLLISLEEEVLDFRHFQAHAVHILLRPQL
jgi:hypothetical protein